jgi:hypothetical protein
MPTILSRILPWVTAVVLAAALKWVFDRVLWDIFSHWLDHGLDFEKTALIVGIASFLLPLAAAVLISIRLFPGPAVDPTLPVLGKHPWQSKPLIVGVLIVVVAVMAGTSYGRLFGLPHINLPSRGQFSD